MNKDFENKLKTIIKECVREVLNEMAMKHSDYIQRVFTLLPQITQNWCLCYFAKNSDNETYKQLLEHWATELIIHLENLEGITLKSGDKQKATYYAFVEAEDLNTNINNILNKIKFKFKTEGIVNPNILFDCASNFQKELTILVDIISNKLEMTASEYVDEKFFET